MLNKILFGNKKSSDISTRARHAGAATTPAGRDSGPSLQRQSRAVKIVHAGGHVEHYYMATPASMIMKKHPSFVLARPDIFRRPWDSVVRSDEILVPGQKYYVVPRRTVKKLRRRIRKPSATGPGFSLTESENASKSSICISSILVKPGIKAKARNLHVRFFGIDSSNTNQQDGDGDGDGDNDAVSNISTKKSGNKSNEKKERARIQFAWEPALQSITE